jgi:hypothetical protein
MRQLHHLLGVSACAALLAVGTVACSSTSSTTGAGGAAAGASASLPSTTTTTAATGFVTVTGTLEDRGDACLVLHGDDGVDWAISQSPSALGLIVPEHPNRRAVIVDANGTALAHDGDHVTVQGLQSPDSGLECQTSTMVMLVSMVAPG